MKNWNTCDCCLNCRNFSFWDGDYVCPWHWELHQAGYQNKGGYIINTWMNEDIDQTMQTPETCPDYDKNNDIEERNNWMHDEYARFMKWKEEKALLNSFVH